MPRPSADIEESEKQKGSIEIIPTALKTLISLKGINFKWERNGKSGCSILWSSVDENFPIAARKTEEGNLWVDPRAIVALQTEAIKELLGQVKAQEARLNKLEEKPDNNGRGGV